MRKTMIPGKWVRYPAALQRRIIPICQEQFVLDHPRIFARKFVGFGSKKCPVTLLRLGFFTFIGIFLLLVGIVFAHEEDLTAGKDLVDKKIKCNDMTEEQLEHIGDYMMEQMHPGEAHEKMDEAMGGEGSDNLKQTHIRMAKMMYCGEGNIMNMMGGNMMQNNAQGMMSGWGMNPFWGSLAMLLILAVLVLLIVFLVKKIKE